MCTFSELHRCRPEGILGANATLTLRSGHATAVPMPCKHHTNATLMLRQSCANTTQVFLEHHTNTHDRQAILPE